MGITRAREKLYLINARQRMLYGTTSRNMQSRFVGEIPDEVTEDRTVKLRSSFSTSTSDYGSHFGTPAKPHKYSRSTPIPRGEATRASSVAHAFGQVNSAATSHASYAVGDTVRHKTFGTGVVISAQPMGNDTLMEIAFDKAGTKKLMANFAKLEKL